MSARSSLSESLFGAVADELSGAMDDATYRATGFRGESAAALTALLNTPGLSVKELARFLGMSSPSAVELASRLESEGLLNRHPGPDRRTRSLQLTARGRENAELVLAVRRAESRRRLDQLTHTQQSALHECLRTLLGSMRRLDVDLDHLCRRCDESVCTPAKCPVGHDKAVR